MKESKPTAPTLLQLRCVSPLHACALELRITSVRLLQAWLPLMQIVFLPALKAGHQLSFCTYFPLQKLSLFSLRPPVPGSREGWGSEKRMLSQQMFLMVLGKKKKVETLLQGGKGLISKAAVCI